MINENTPLCGKCGESLKSVAVSHLKCCLMNKSNVPSFAFVQDYENEQGICLNCCESDPLLQPYPADGDIILN
jgi:tRNA(Ile2) C34 agmatinyltransferase TiaS